MQLDNGIQRHTRNTGAKGNTGVWANRSNRSTWLDGHRIICILDRLWLFLLYINKVQLRQMLTNPINSGSTVYGTGVSLTSATTVNGIARQEYSLVSYYFSGATGGNETGL